MFVYMDIWRKKSIHISESTMEVIVIIYENVPNWVQQDSCKSLYDAYYTEQNTILQCVVIIVINYNSSIRRNNS